MRGSVEDCHALARSGVCMYLMAIILSQYVTPDNKTHGIAEQHTRQ